MRSFLWFAALIAVGFAFVALTAWPAWLLIHPEFSFPFHRVASRIGYLFLAASLYPFLRFLGLANRRSLGYDLPPRVFGREFLIALGLGVATMLPVVLIMLGLGLLEPKSDGVRPAVWLMLGLKGLLTGIFVSFGEETFTRGALYSGIARDSGPRLAVPLSALVYAAFHFIGRVRIPAEDVTARSGLTWVSDSLQAFSHPFAIADAFLALTAVGILLALVRLRTGHIAACIGLHAGWVWIITLVRETSVPDRRNPLAWLLSQFDGVVGWLVLGWTVLIGVVLWGFYARRSRALAPPRAPLSPPPPPPSAPAGELSSPRV
jgi:membrane protease YdiL (CAAX protease family)